MEAQRSIAWSDFAAEERDLCLLCHQLAKTYGGPPSSWRRRSMEDLSFDRLCLQIGEEAEAEARRRLTEIMPVIVVG
jgi:hypothetical protein